MKKVKLLLFMLCGLLLFVATAKAADGPYIFDWDTNSESNVSLTNNIPFKDGYIIYSIKYNNENYSSKIVGYDKSGKEIKTLTTNNLVVAMVTDDDYAYGLYITEDEKTILVKYDSKLEKVKEVVISNEEPQYPYFVAYRDPYMSVTDKIAMLNIIDNKITVIDKDLNEKTDVRDTYANYKKYFKETIELYDAWEEVNPSSYGDSWADLKNNQFVYTSNENTCPDDDIPSNASGHSFNANQSEPSHCYKAYITLLDKNYDEIWEKEFDEYAYFNAVKFVDDYIIVAGVKENSQKGDLLVLDLKGNVLQTISDSSYYESIVDTPRGFIVTETTCPMTLGAIGGLGDLDDVDLANIPNSNVSDASPLSGIKKDSTKGYLNISPIPIMNCSTKHQVYYLYHKIETKVSSGKGKIEVIGQQKPGEPVTFKITPEKGYVLSKVLVTDSTGKTIVFTNNVFTMPNADVTIEAIFVKSESKSIINPDTGIGITILFTGIALASFAFLLYSKKKLKWLK